MNSRNGSQALGRPIGGFEARGAPSPRGGPIVAVVMRIPTSDPEGAMAGFGSGSGADSPEGASAGAGPDGPGSGALPELAGFAPSEPGGAMAGFGAACADWMTFATVPRSTPSRRAIRRCDHCNAWSWSIA